MHNMIRRFSAATVSAAVVLFAFEAMAIYDDSPAWREGKYYDGPITMRNATTPLVHTPDTRNRINFSPDGGVYNVQLPATNFVGALWIYASEGYTPRADLDITFDGRGNLFGHFPLYPGEIINTTGADSFVLNAFSYTAIATLNGVSGSNSSTETYVWSNTVMRVQTNPDLDFHWGFEGGMVSFCGRSGDIVGNRYMCFPSQQKDAYFTFAVTNAVAYFPEILFKGQYRDSLFSISGGSFTEQGNFQFDYEGSITETGTNRLDITDGAKANFKGTMYFGQNTANNLEKRFDVVDIHGEGVVVTNGGSFYSKGNLDLAVRDGAKFLRPGAGSNFEAPTSADNEDTWGSDHFEFTGTGTEVDMTGGALFKIGGIGSSLAITDGVEVRLPRSLRLGLHGGSLDFEISGEDTTVYLTGNDGDSTFIGFDGEVNGVMNGGYLGAREGDENGYQLRFGHQKDADVTFTLKDGVINLPSRSGNSIVDVGLSGSATFKMEGGELYCGNSMRLGLASNQSSMKKSLFHMTGGTAYFHEAVNLATADTEYRESEVRLDGGRLTMDQLYSSCAKADDKHVESIVTANGGTIVPRQTRDSTTWPWVRNLDGIYVGPNGLTVDTDGKNARVVANITNLGESSGVFRKTGEGTLYVNGSFTADNFVVAGGTLLQDEETKDINGRLVLEGGAYSMAGPAEELVVDSLAFGGGRLLLDQRDIVVVQGTENIDLTGLRVEFTTAPTADSPFTCFRFQAPLSSENQAALRRAACANAAPEGRHAKFSYDPDSGEVSFDFVVDAQPIDPSANATWTATDDQNAGWSVNNNWSTYYVPTDQQRAVFDDSHTVKNVIVDGNVFVGAIGFAGTGFTLTGEDSASITIAAEQGAAEIATDSDEYAEVAVKVKGREDTRVNLKTGSASQLTLSGPLEVNALAKMGKGTLVLSGDNRINETAATYGGITEVVNTNAFRGASAVQLCGDTLALNAEGMKLPKLVIDNDPANRSPVVLKVDQDALVNRLEVTGGLEKRGTGRLTLDYTGQSGDIQLASLNGAGANNRMTSYNVTSFPADGSPLGDDYVTGILVGEGELVIKDTGSPKASLVSRGQISVGLNLSDMDENAQAKLTLDGVSLTAYANCGHTTVGWGLCRDDYESKQISPALELKNGTTFLVDTILLNCGCGNHWYGAHPRLTANDSKIVAGRIQFCDSGIDDNYTIVGCTNSTILSTYYSLYAHGPCDITFNNCQVGGADGAYLGAHLDSTITYSSTDISRPENAPVNANYGKFLFGVFNNNVMCPTGRVEVTNGSLMRARLCCYNTIQKQVEFVWDDSEWDYDNNYSFVFEDGSAHSYQFNDKFVMTMRGKGIKLRPAAGTTFTVSHPFVGEGGMQNVGAGTVRFLPGAYRFTGTASAASGATIDFADAGTVENAMLGGAGTFHGGTLENAAIAFSADKPVLDGVTLTGTGYIDFGRASDDPVPQSAWENLEVATYTGSAPACTWRVRNAGAGIHGTVTAQDGHIKVTLKRHGAMLIFR